MSYTLSPITGISQREGKTLKLMSKPTHLYLDSTSVVIQLLQNSFNTYFKQDCVLNRFGGIWGTKDRWKILLCEKSESIQYTSIYVNVFEKTSTFCKSLVNITTTFLLMLHVVKYIFYIWGPKGSFKLRDHWGITISGRPK